MSDSPTQSSLSVGIAIQESWQTFKRTPWPFVFFALLAFIINTLINLIPNPRAWYIAWLLADLWFTIGMMRGVWISLNGDRPQFGDFLRINPAATWRLFSRQFVLGILLMIISVASLGLALMAADAGELVTELYNLSMATDPTDPEQITAWIPTVQNLALTLTQSPIALVSLLIGALIGIYLQVNQAFLGYLAVVKGLGPIATIQQGISTVQSQWWQVLGLLGMQVVILLIGFLACGFGLLAAIPVVFGVTASAYRQLFGAEDEADFLIGHLAAQTQAPPDPPEEAEPPD